MAGKNFSEYTKLRDIVVKRNKRAVAAGLAAPIHFPTVREIKSGLVSSSEALRAVKEFYSGGSQVTAIRQTGIAPEFKQFPSLPPERKKTDLERREQRREQERRYRRRKRILKDARNEKEAKSLLYALRAVETLERIWNKGGKKRLDIRLSDMSPKEAFMFAEYINYRFSQSDFTQIYVIDEFVQDFSKLRKRGYTPQQIQKDFDLFLENRTRLQVSARNVEGLEPDQLRKYWDEFVGE